MCVHAAHVSRGTKPCSVQFESRKGVCVVRIRKRHHLAKRAMFALLFGQPRRTPRLLTPLPTLFRLVFISCTLHEQSVPGTSSPSAAFDTDLLVVGCGIAGAASALQAARLGMRVTMLSSAPNVDDCNSFWAQGGIIYKAEVSPMHR